MESDFYNQHSRVFPCRDAIPLKLYVVVFAAWLISPYSIIIPGVILKKEFVFVYICRDGENEELRYSLRSIDLFYPEAKVWVVGGKPGWYSGNFIKVKQTSYAFENVKNSLIAILNSQEIPDHIVVMNDDFFFVRRVDDIKSYISGTLENKILFNKLNNVNSPYIRKVTHLYHHCKKHRRPPLDFETHAPMKIDKQNLSLIINDNVMWRSNYGNRFVLEKDLEIIEDVKVYKDEKYSFKSYDFMSLKYPFFSTQDTSFDLVYKKMLSTMFATPSKYELKIASSS